MKLKTHEFNTLGELIFWAYSNFQMYDYALSKHLKVYDRTCYMISAKAYRQYRIGGWHIHNQLLINVEKMRDGNHCWYCGEEFSDGNRMTVDHIFPKSRGGGDDMDNIFPACGKCNSSKGNADLMEWFRAKNQALPPFYVTAAYLKLVYEYADSHNLMGAMREDLDSLTLPFNWRFIPYDFSLPDSEG